MANTIYVNSAWTDQAAFDADTAKPAGAVWDSTAFATIKAALDVIKDATGDADVKYTIQLNGTFDEAVVLDWKETNDITFVKADGAEKAEITGKVVVGFYAGRYEKVAYWQGNLLFDGITFDYSDARDAVKDKPVDGVNWAEVNGERFEIVHIDPQNSLTISDCTFKGPGVIDAGYNGGQPGNHDGAVDGDNGGNLLSVPWGSGYYQGAIKVENCDFFNGNVSLWRGDLQFDGCSFENVPVTLLGTSDKAEGYNFTNCEFSLDLSNVPDGVKAYLIGVDENGRSVNLGEGCTLKMTGTPAEGETAAYIFSQAPNEDSNNHIAKIEFTGVVIEGDIPEGAEFLVTLSPHETKEDWNCDTVGSTFTASDLAGVTAEDVKGAANVTITSSDSSVVITTDGKGDVTTTGSGNKQYAADAVIGEGFSEIYNGSVVVGYSKYVDGLPVAADDGKFKAEVIVEGSLTANGTYLWIGGDTGTAERFGLVVDGGTVSNRKGEGTYLRPQGYLEVLNGGTFDGCLINASDSRVQVEGTSSEDKSTIYLTSNALNATNTEVTIGKFGQLIMKEDPSLGGNATINLKEGSTLKVEKDGYVENTVNNTTIDSGSTFEVAGGSVDLKNVDNQGTFKVTGKDASTVKAAITGKALQLENGVLENSDITGNIQVTGESAMRGDINLADKSIVKVSGGKLTIEDGASLVGPAHSTDLPHVPKNFGVSLVAGQTNESWVEKDGLSNQGAGTVEVVGDVFAGQVHATADGKITVAATGSVVASEMSAGVSKMESGKAGVIDIYGDVTGQLISANAGGAINVYEGGTLSTSVINNERRRITVNAGSELNVNGGSVIVDIANKTIGGESTLNVNGSMTISNGGSVVVNRVTDPDDNEWKTNTATNGINITGTVEVTGGTVSATSVTNNGTFTVSGESTLNVATLSGKTIDLMDGAIVKDSTVGGGVFVAGDVTFRGDNTFGMITDFGTLTDYYGTTAPMAWTVEAGASVTLTNTARYGLGYGDKVVVNGEIAANGAAAARATLTDDDSTNDVKQSLFMHGLVAQESAGWNCDSSFTVNNAFVTIGSNSSFGSKAGNYGGNYTFSFNNSVLNASRITFYNTNAKTTFTLTGSDVEIGQFMTRDQDSVFTLDNTKLYSTSTINGNDEGQYNAAELNVTNGSTLTYSAEMFNEATGVINVDNATFVAPEVKNSNEFNVKGESTLNISKLTGNVIQVSDAVLTADITGGDLAVQSNTELKNVTVSGGEIWVSGLNTDGSVAKATVTGTVKHRYGIIGGTDANGNMANWFEGYTSAAGGQLEVAKGAEYNVEELSIHDKGTLTIKGKSDISCAYVWSKTGALNVEKGGSFSAVWLEVNGEMNVAGTVKTRQGDYFGIVTINDGGKLNVSGLFDHGGAVVNNGTIALDGSEKTVTFTANTVTNSGTITMDATSTITAADITGSGSVKLVVNVDDFSGYSKLIDLSRTESNSFEDEITISYVDKDGNTAEPGDIKAIYGNDGDVALAKIDDSTLFVNSEWNEQGDVDAFFGTSYDPLWGGNAFSSMTDVTAPETATSLHIFGGNYANPFGDKSSDEVNLLKGGITTVAADNGTVTLTLGNLVFNSKNAGEYNINGNFALTDYGRQLWVNGKLEQDWSTNGSFVFTGVEGTVYNIDGNLAAGDAFLFDGVKAVISADSLLTTADVKMQSGADAKEYVQMNIYNSEVINNGKIKIDLTESENGSLLNVGKNNGEAATLTVSGKDASLYVAMVDADTASWANYYRKTEVNLYNGKLNVEEGASFETTGAVNVYDNFAITVTGGATFSAGIVSSEGSITVSDGATFSAETVEAFGTFTVSGENTIKIGALTGTITLKDEAYIDDKSSITGGTITVEDDATLYWKAVFGATITVNNSLAFEGVKFEANGETTIYSGNVAINNELIINGESVVWNDSSNKVAGTILVGSDIYDVSVGEGSITAEKSKDVYTEISVSNLTVEQGTDDYTFTIKTTATGEGLKYTYSYTPAGGETVQLGEGVDRFTIDPSILDGTDGKITVSVTVEDQYGKSASASTKVTVTDYTDPVMTVTTLDKVNEWTNKDVTFTADATDVFSSVTVTCTYNGADVTPVDGKYSFTTDKIINGDVVFTAEDAYGRTASEQSFKVQIDKLDPELSSCDYSLKNGRIVVNYSAKDQEGASGVAKVKFYVDGQKAGESENEEGSFSFEPVNESTAFYLEVIDAAGNVYTSETETVKVSGGSSGGADSSQIVQDLHIGSHFTDEELKEMEENYSILPEGESTVSVQKGFSAKAKGFGKENGTGSNNISLGKGSSLEVYENIDNLGDVSIGKYGSLTVLSQKEGAGETLSGTDDSQSVGVGKGAGLHVCGNLDLGDGHDVLSSGKYGKIEISGDLIGGAGNDSVGLGKGSGFTADSVDLGVGDDALSTGKYSAIDIAGAFEGGAGNDSIGLGKGSSFAAASVDLGAGDDALSTGKYSAINITGAFEGGAGNDSVGLGKGSSFAAASVDFGAGNDALSTGKYGAIDIDGAFNGGDGSDSIGLGKGSSFAAASVDFGDGNDTFSFGKYASARIGGNLDFGAGYDTLSFGKGNTLEIEGALTGVEEINCAYGSIYSGEDFDFDNVAGNWDLLSLFHNAGEVNAGAVIKDGVYRNEMDIYTAADNLTLDFSGIDNVDVDVWSDGAWRDAALTNGQLQISAGTSFSVSIDDDNAGKTKTEYEFKALA